MSIQVDALVECEGAFTIPAKLFLECIRTFPKGGMITIEVREGRMIVSCGKRKFTLDNGCEASEYPHMWQMMVLGTGAPYVVGSTMLQQAINEVQFAAASDESRPVLATVCMHVQEAGVELAAADAFRLVVSTLPLKARKDREATILIPVSSLRLLAEVIPADVPVIVAWDRACAHVVFQAAEVQFTARLVEGTYPNVRAVIPVTHTSSFTLPRKQLEQILKAFKLIARESSNILNLVYQPRGVVTFRAESEDFGEVEDELEVAVNGPEGNIIFNIQYLADMLRFISAQEFIFYLSGANQPVVVVPDGCETYRYVLMPMSRNR